MKKSSREAVDSRFSIKVTCRIQFLATVYRLLPTCSRSASLRQPVRRLNKNM